MNVYKRYFVQLCLLTVCLGAVRGDEPPNYLVTDFFETTDPELFYTVNDFNNERMVCGTWQRIPLVGLETDRGIFVWRDGVMRHISPASGNLQFVRSPESTVRMTNVLPDGTVFLVAAATQTTEDDGNGPRNIIRTIRYSINADLASFPQPVISAISLRGRLNPELRPPYVVEEDSFGPDVDVSDEGAVMAGNRILNTTGGFAQKWFADGLEDSWGTLKGFDRNGSVYGFAPNVNGNPAGSFSYITPLAGLTPMGGTSQLRWPVPSWADSRIGLNPYAVHGEYRVGTPFSWSQPQTGVWTNDFEDEIILFDFEIYSGLGGANNRNCLTRDGHLLGYDYSIPFFYPRATALRQTDGSYTVKTIASQLTYGYRTVPPYASPQSTNPLYEPFVLGMNDNLDWVAELWTNNFSNGRGFFILRDQPGPGEIFTYTENLFANENTPEGVSIVFERRLGSSGPASLRVTLADGGAAKAGSDFNAGETAVIQWAAGESGVKTVDLPLIDDPYEEDTETVKVVVSEVQNASYAGDLEFFGSVYGNDEGGGFEPDPDPVVDPNVAILAKIESLRNQIVAVDKKLKAAGAIKNKKSKARRIKSFKQQRLALLNSIQLLSGSLR